MGWTQSLFFLCCHLRNLWHHWNQTFHSKGGANSHRHFGHSQSRKGTFDFHKLIKKTHPTVSVFSFKHKENYVKSYKNDIFYTLNPNSGTRKDVKNTF